MSKSAKKYKSQNGKFKPEKPTKQYQTDNTRSQNRGKLKKTPNAGK